MGPEKRLLIVDDDDAIRALVSTVLRRRGFHVDVARNGAEALENIALQRYGLIVLDLMMPRVSGYEVLDHLATLPTDERPLVLVLTAGLEPKSLDPRFVIGTIHKPFDIRLLVDTVAACVSTPSESHSSMDETVTIIPGKAN